MTHEQPGHREIKHTLNTKLTNKTREIDSTYWLSQHNFRLLTLVSVRKRAKSIPIELRCLRRFGTPPGSSVHQLLHSIL